MTDRIRKYEVFELMLHSSVNYRHPYLDVEVVETNLPVSAEITVRNQKDQGRMVIHLLHYKRCHPVGVGHAMVVAQYGANEPYGGMTDAEG